MDSWEGVDYNHDKIERYKVELAERVGGCIVNIDKVQIFRGEILHCLADPAEVGDDSSYEYFPDGLMIVKSGLVEHLGPAQELLHHLPADAVVTHYPDSLIVPGFIDCHLHYPQTEMIASYGEQLLEWLETYTFPTERQFGDSCRCRG